MKRIFYRFLLFCVLIPLNSCKDFLDVQPDSSLTEEDVFTKIGNVNSYLTPAYSDIRNANPLWMKFWNNRYNLEECTEAYDCGRGMGALAIRKGIMLDAVDGYIEGKYDVYRPVLTANFHAIRICNKVLANASRIEDAISPKDIYDIIGQAYFLRGYAYFQLCCLWGGMPYMYNELSSDDDWDRPRLSAKETFVAVAADMDLAYENFIKAEKVRRDPKPGEAGHLNPSYKLNLPNGCAALALKSRALLYAASPLSNTNGDEQLWKDAADASWKAIEIAKENGYSLLPISQWLNNTWNVQYTNEQIWADNIGRKAPHQAVLHGIVSGAMNNRPATAAGMCPTQNFVDRYETKPMNGHLAFPMNTEDQRNAAEKSGVYNPQNPYVNLDLRFHQSIYYNWADIPLSRTLDPYSTRNKINMWYQTLPTGEIIESEHIKSKGFVGYSTTGYLQKRLTGDMNWTNSRSRQLTDPLFMLSELYLNYAEATNEFGGPEFAVDGGITSHEALMVIRNRAKQGEVRPEFLKNKDEFRERIKNERCIELALLGHYYYDSYRWKDAEKYRVLPIYKMTVEKLTGNYDKSKYPQGFRYKRDLIIDSHQAMVWRDEMYYFPFSRKIYNQFKNFDTSLNPYW